MHFIWTLLADTENCKGQEIQPFNEQIQTWLKLKQKADSLRLRCPQQRGKPKAVSAFQHGCWGGEGRTVSVAWILRTLPAETRTKTEFSLEQQSWAASATDIRGTWLPMKLGLIHCQSHSKMRLAQNEPSSDGLPRYAASFQLYTQHSQTTPRKWNVIIISEGIFSTLYYEKWFRKKTWWNYLRGIHTITKIIPSLQEEKCFGHQKVC